MPRYAWLACAPLFLAVVGCLGDPQQSTPTVKRIATAEGGGRFVVDEMRSTLVSQIETENLAEGTDAWLVKGPAGGAVEGYASVTSAAPGERVGIFVNTDKPRLVTWALYRVGYYQAHGARLMASGDAGMVTPQAACPIDSSTGMIECHWKPTFDLPIRPNYWTGQYLIKLSADGHESYVPLVVRESRPRAPILVQSSVATWQAYNDWGGISLYGSKLTAADGFAGKRATRVSFDRPYACSASPEDVNAQPCDSDEGACTRRPPPPKNRGCVQGAGQFFSTERWMIAWLERQGYDVAYVTSLDVDAHPEWLEGRKLVITMGHDEYWSLPERNAFETARDSGVSLGFFVGNSGYWRVRLEPSSTGAPRRSMNCYRDAMMDPVSNAPDTTVKYRDAPFARPEEALYGVMYEGLGEADVYPHVVSDSTHWIYDGTGVQDGDVLPNVLGNEWDSALPSKFAPKRREVIAHAYGVSRYGATIPADSVVYYPTAESVVFAAGSIDWVWGLDREGFVDARMQRMAENVITRAGIAPRHPTVVPDLPDGDGPPMRVLAGEGRVGYLDGPADMALFDAPTGVARAPDGTIYVVDQRNNRIRAISPRGMVSTLAGCGPEDSADGSFADGQGADACFSAPTGIALAPDGVLYVSDTGNHAIRAVTPAGVVTTASGSAFESGNVDAADPLAARFEDPRAVSVGPDGALYIADSGIGSVRKLDVHGVTTVAKIPGVSGVTVDGAGQIYAAYGAKGALFAVNSTGGARRLTGGGPGFVDGGSASTRAEGGMVVDRDQLVFTDAGNYALRALSLTGTPFVTTLAGAGGARQRMLALPRGIALAPNGYVIADTGHHRIVSVPRLVAPAAVTPVSTGAP
jgi:hypothetical protein